VVYRIQGFLKDSSKYFSTSAMLNAKVMDHLQEEKIEIKKDYLHEIDKNQEALKEMNSPVISRD
jgi:hypothetical protein